MKKYLTAILPYVFILVCILPLIGPLFQMGFFSTDDGTGMVIRLSAFHETLKTGQFPVRFLERLNNGYGYPVTNFLYPLPFYFGEVIYLLGFGFIDSVKILFLLSFLLSAVFMYVLVQKEWGKWAGIAAAIYYVWVPYRIFDVYRRGSLGEAFAFIWLPLVFYFLNRMFGERKLKWLALGSLAYAALIASHNVVAFLFTPVIVCFLFLKVAASKFNRLTILTSIFFTLLAFAISAWFWFPALYDLQYTRAGQTVVANYREYFVTFSNILQVFGIAPIVILVITSVYITLSRKYETVYLVAVSAAALFFTLPASEFIWQNTPLPRLVQFPWRFFSVIIFTTSVLLGYLVGNRKRITILLAVSALIFSIIPSYPLVKIDRNILPESYYTTNESTTTVKDEYMPISVKNNLPGRSGEIKRVYFPGHKVIINGKAEDPKIDENGVIISPGKIIFTETTPRLIADLVSVAGLIIAVMFIFL